MKLFRFMSIAELKKLLNKEELSNNTKHEAHTNSVGFCFMKYKETPEEAYEYLSGIVSNDVCVVFETNKRLKKTYGIYADPIGSFFDTITKDEYCINKYSLKDFKILQLAKPKYSNSWKWYTNVNEYLKYFDIQKHKQDLEAKQKKEINISKKELKKEQIKKFFKFIETLNEKKEVEMKIDNKYYRFGAYAESLEESAWSNILTMKIIV